jgi:hypothetical protein
MSFYVSSFDDTDTKLEDLVKKFDEYIVQLADRLSSPDQGFLGASGSMDIVCMKGLMHLKNAVVVRNVIFNSGMPPMFGYRQSDETKKAAEKLQSMFKDIPIDAAPAISLPAGLAKRDDVKLIAFALHGIKALASNEACSKHVRIQNFSANTASKPGKGMLGIEKFKADAGAWLKRKGYDAAELTRYMEEAATAARMLTEDEVSRATRTLGLSERLDALIGRNPSARTLELRGMVANKKGSVSRLTDLETELSKQPGGTSGGGAGGMYGGYRKYRKANKNRKTRKGKKANRKTKSRRHH